MRGLATYCLIGLAILFAGSALHGADANHATAKPSIVIPVQPLDYGPPGELYLTMRYSNVSLDFVDAGHLLFTFQKKGLLRHSEDELPGDQDQVIHAVVLDLPDGKVSASADWRMHDRRRYLWPLSPGTFLIRQRDSLFLTDSTLELRPYGQFSGRLMGVQVSPGGDLLVTQSEQPGETGQSRDKGVAAANNSVADPSRPSVSKPLRLQVFRVKDRVQIAQSRVRRPTNLPVNGNGFVESLEGRTNQWKLSFTSLTEGQVAAKPFAEVSSACQPILTFVSEQTVLAIRCTPSHDHLATFLTLQGKLLWEQKWQAHREWPTWSYSHDGTRFAEGMLTTSLVSPDHDSSEWSERLTQRVDVFDTASGKLLLSVPASPAYDAGQNFALSADGRRLVILHSGAIEVYDLPAEGK